MSPKKKCNECEESSDTPIKEVKVKKEKKEKKKRQPSAYSIFVKENYNKVRDLHPKERFKKIGEMWKEKKNKK